MSEKNQKLLAVIGMVAFVAILVGLEIKNKGTEPSMQERISDCEDFACIVKASEKSPSLCHLKAHGQFTRAIVECDATCEPLRADDPDVFDCWPVEACARDAECAALFGIE